MKKRNKDLEDRQILLFEEFELDELPSVSELPDGRYKALFYSCVFELENGKMYKTDYGIRRSRRFSSWETYEVKNGEFRVVKNL